MPPLSLERPFLMRMPRVSAFLPEMTQHIHSLRASGVVSFHTARALGFEASAARQSAGRVCTSVVETTLVAMQLFYQKLVIYGMTETIALRLFWVFMLLCA